MANLIEPAQDFKISEDVKTIEPSVGSRDVDTSTTFWTDNEERKLVRKLDCLIMPLLVLGFVALQLDRGNISYALTDFFFKDVSIVQNQFNIGQQLLLAGIVILEIPSNLVLYRLGPCLWITCQILAWALVSTFQAFQKGLGAFLATRLLLGLCEGGFIPAGLYCITTWYKTSETSTRFAIFFLGNTFATASSGLYSYGILNMRGIAGLTGWQWLFILEGIFTFLIGLLFAALLPKSPFNPVSLCGLKFFSEREMKILAARGQNSGLVEGNKRPSVSRKDLIGALTNWQIYPHLLMAITGLAPAGTLGGYAPTIVNSFGYGRLKSNALSSVGPWIQLFVLVFFGWLADKTNRRGFVVLLGISLWWAFSLGCRLVSGSNSKGKRYALLTLALSFVGSWHPINGSWLAINSRNDAQRSITMAMFIMFTNIGGIIGGFIFRSDDAPRYRRGWTIVVTLVSAGVFFCLLANILYRFLNARIDTKTALGEVDTEENRSRVTAEGKYHL